MKIIETSICKRPLLHLHPKQGELEEPWHERIAGQGHQEIKVIRVYENNLHHDFSKLTFFHTGTPIQPSRSDAQLNVREQTNPSLAINSFFFCVIFEKSIIDIP